MNNMTTNSKFINLPQQQYATKPLTKEEVRGKSAGTVFTFMTTSFDELERKVEEDAEEQRVRYKVYEDQIDALGCDDYWDNLNLIPAFNYKISTIIDTMAFSHPKDVDDFERIRALLLFYPEWLSRLPEMGRLCRQWRHIANNYSTLISLYEADYLKYSNNGFGVGTCDKLIRELVAASSGLWITANNQ